MANFVQNYNGGVQFKTGASQGLTVDIDGNLGIGVTPSAWSAGKGIELGYNGNSIWSSNQKDFFMTMNTSLIGGVLKYSSTNPASMYEQYNGLHNWYIAPSGTAGGTITFTQAMTLDSSGNLGLGVTPSLWKSNRKVIEFPTSSISDNGLMLISVGVNNYQDSSGQSIYKSNGYASSNYQNAGGHYWLTAPSGTAGNPITWKNAMTLDTSGNLLLTSGTGALGYGTGAGGTVTQLTSKSTAVTLNKPSGTIIMNNAALAAGSSISFTLNNNLIDQQCSFGLTPNGNSNYSITPLYSSIGYVVISVKNNSGGSLSEALQFSFTIIKGATA